MARTKQEEQTFLVAFERFGEPHQLMLCFEEMAELMKAISKAIRYSREGHKTHITEEIADVEIMLEQVKMIFDIQGRPLHDGSSQQFIIENGQKKFNK